MMNALRLKEGFNGELFETRTHLDLNEIGTQLKTAKEKGLLDIKEGRYLASTKGWSFLNDLMEIFI